MHRLRSKPLDDDYGKLLLDFGSVCTPDQGPQNPRLNVQKEAIAIPISNDDIKSDQLLNGNDRILSAEHRRSEVNV